jgi:hypothetical protein
LPVPWQRGLHAHLAMPAAGGASGGGGARFCAGAMTSTAFGHGGDAYLRIGTPCGLFQGDLEVVAQVGTSLHAVAPPAASAAKDVTENVGKIKAGSPARAERTTAAHASRFECRMAMLVISGAFLRVAQYFVSFLGFLEMFFGFRVVGIAVGVMLHRQFAIGLFYFLV